MSNLVEVLVPDIGNFDSVDVIEVLVKAGDVIAKEDSLITVESDKASMDIPSSHAGTVKEVKVKVGDKVAKDSLILLVEAQAAGATAPAKTEAPSPAPTPAAQPTAAPAPQGGRSASGPALQRPVHSRPWPSFVLSASDACALSNPEGQALPIRPETRRAQPSGDDFTDS